MEHHDAYTPSNTPPVTSVGARLKASREAQGLGLGEVADRLKLSLRQLEAIESDHFSTLPGATFVRGFVRNYARFLELDPEPLMRDLEAQFPSSVRDVANLTKGDQPHALEDKPAELEVQPVRANHKGAWLGLALVGVVVAGLAWWMVDGRNHHDEAAAPEQQEGHLAPMLTEASHAAAKPASAAAAVTKPAASTAVAAAKPAIAASAPAAAPAKPAAASAPVAAAAPAKPVAPAAADKSKAASAPAASAASGSVRLVTKGDAWVAVTDADGNKLVYQLLGDGTEKTVSGKAPLKVVLGNASNVQLYFNGQAVDFTSKIKGATAKIELK